MEDITGLEFTVAETKAGFNGNPNLNEDDWFPAILKNISPWQSQYGQQLSWEFELQGEKFSYEHEGAKKQVIVKRPTSMASSPKSKMYELYTKLVGKEPAVGEKMNLRGLLGMPCYVMLKAKKSNKANENGEFPVFHNVDRIKRREINNQPPQSTPQQLATQPAQQPQPVQQPSQQPMQQSTPTNNPGSEAPAEKSQDIFNDIF